MHNHTFGLDALDVIDIGRVDTESVGLPRLEMVYGAVSRGGFQHGLVDLLLLTIIFTALDNVLLDLLGSVEGDLSFSGKLR